MERRLKYKTEQYKKALDGFIDSLKIDLKELPENIADTVKSGQVQKFEISTELLWKTLKIFLLQVHGIRENSPKAVIKSLYTIQLINGNEYETLIKTIENRNLLSHIYNQDQFQEIYLEIKETPKIFLKALKIINESTETFQ